MSHLNTINIVGRLTKEPRKLEASSTTGWSIDIVSEYESKPFKDKEAKKEIIYLSAACWGAKADKMSTLVKGQEVFVSGRLRMAEKVDDKGNKRQYWSIAVDTLMFNQRLEEIMGKQFTGPGDLEEVEQLPF